MTTLRWANPVAGSAPGPEAVAVSSAVPGGTSTSTENAPSSPAVVVVTVAAPSRSTFTAETSTVAPGSVVPATATVRSTTEPSAGAVRARSTRSGAPSR